MKSTRYLRTLMWAANALVFALFVEEWWRGTPTTIVVLMWPLLALFNYECGNYMAARWRGNADQWRSLCEDATLALRAQGKMMESAVECLRAAAEAGDIGAAEWVAKYAPRMPK